MLKKVVTENFKMEKEGKIDYNRRTEERNETNWKEKSLSWEWLKLGYVKKNTEATITTNQDQALTTRWIKANVDGVDCYPYAEYAVMWMSYPCTLPVDANSQQSDAI